MIYSADTDGIIGAWGDVESCPPGEYVVGYSLLSEPPQGSGPGANDDTALNAIKLECAFLGAVTSSGPSITSAAGTWGTYGASVNCPSGAVNGFRVRIDRIADNDRTGAVDIDLWCQDGTKISAPGNNDWGDWTGDLTCPTGEAATGLQTRVQAPQGSADADDDTALNGLRLQCKTFVPRKFLI